MDRTDAAGRDHLAALRMIRTATSLVPHQLAVLARQETALAALRVTLDRWLGVDGEPSLDVLRADVDSVLAAGLDRSGA